MSEDTKQESAEHDDTADTEDPAGVEESGFESSNNSREETQAIMEADSPDDIDKDLLQEIEEDRKERLDPDNRPDNTEVDNTQRTFIAEEARFEDTELSEEEKNDGIGQKEPDPEATAGSSDDSDDSDGDDSGDSGDSDEKGADDAKDDDQAQAQQEAESDASTGPHPSGGEEPEAPTASEQQVEEEPGRHKA